MQIARNPSSLPNKQNSTTAQRIGRRRSATPFKQSMTHS